MAFSKKQTAALAKEVKPTALNPLAAGLIILVFCILLAAYMWAGVQKVNLKNFGLAKPLGQDQLVFQYGTRLIQVDAKGAIQAEFDVSAIGQENFMGDFAFFSNGDLLIALKHKPIDMIYQLNAMLRSPNRATEGEEALYRCAWPVVVGKTLDCTAFTQELPPMNLTVRLYINTQDQVYIADTTRHKLWLLDSSGKLLANKEGFQFPNDIRVQGDDVILADTNHHAIKFLNPSAEKFGEEKRALITKLDHGYTWPIAFVQLEHEIWVMIGDGALSNARVAIFDNAGKFVRELALPDEVDPIAMTRFGDEILLLDLAHFAIYSFDLNGKQLQNFALPSLAAELAENYKNAQVFSHLQQNCLWVFALLMALGFGVAIPLHLRDTQRIKKVVDKFIANSATAAPEEIWIHPAAAFTRLLKITFIAYSLALVAIVSVLLSLDIFNLSLGVYSIVCILVVLLVAIAAASVKTFQYLSEQKIGIANGKLIYCSSGEKRSEDLLENILWHDTAIFIGETVIRVNSNNRVSIFSYEELVRYVLPYLNPEKKLSNRRVAIYQLFGTRKRRLKFLAILVLFVAIILVNNFLAR